MGEKRIDIKRLMQGLKANEAAIKQFFESSGLDPVSYESVGPDGAIFWLLTRPLSEIEEPVVREAVQAFRAESMQVLTQYWARMRLDSRGVVEWYQQRFADESVVNVKPGLVTHEVDEGPKQGTLMLKGGSRRKAKRRTEYGKVLYELEVVWQMSIARHRSVAAETWTRGQRGYLTKVIKENGGVQNADKFRAVFRHAAEHWDYYRRHYKQHEDIPNFGFAVAKRGLLYSNHMALDRLYEARSELDFWSRNSAGDIEAPSALRQAFEEALSEVRRRKLPYQEPGSAPEEDAGDHGVWL